MIILQDSEGKQLKVEDGERYDGRQWHVVGSEPSPHSQEEIDATTIIQQLAGELQTEGIQWGDVLKVLFKPVALLMGKSHCLSCDVRQAITNSASSLVRKFGKLEALSIMKQLIKDSFSQQPLDVMKKLKEILE